MIMAYYDDIEMIMAYYRSQSSKSDYDNTGDEAGDNNIQHDNDDSYIYNVINHEQDGDDDNVSNNDHD